jgi:hypothetical protein
VQRLLTILFLLVGVTAFAAEPPALRVEIHGRALMHRQPVDSTGYGLLGVSLFVGEPLLVTVTAFNTPKDNTDDWTRHLQWSITSESGEPVVLTMQRDFGSPVKTPYIVRLTRPDAVYANFKLRTPDPGRYIVALTWKDDETGESSSADKRLLAIYRGDEEPLIRSSFLRHQAKTALAQGTLESYQKARTLLLQAAEGNSDPSYYEEFADASLAWAPPAETAAYYQRSLDIATANLEKNLGPRQEAWPASALKLYRDQAGKVEAFRGITPYYAANFNQVRVVLSSANGQQVFVVERRNDGKRIRVVAPPQQ